MQPSDGVLSTSVLVALASELFTGNGYRVVRDLTDFPHSADRGLLAEDEFSVVSVVTFETWHQLENEWLETQADLVELLARRLSRAAPKAWDGYLVLLCAGEPPQRRAVSAIERDTTRVRKIVATGEMLRTSADVARVLDLLLPLTVPKGATMLEDVLDSLPEVMKLSADPSAVRVVVDAFRSMEPPLERLHALRGEQ
jgi:hypothetical protein